MSGGRWWLALVVALVLAALPATAAAAPTDLSVLVLGDSYSAGNGAGAYAGTKGCRQSPNNYGRAFERLVETPAQPVVVTTVACSGATTSSLRHGAKAQVLAVDGSYDLVVLTIGGNDAGFTPVVASCLLAGTREPRACDAALGRAERLTSSGTLLTRIRATLSAIGQRADRRARIVVVGYPYLEGNPAFRVRTVEAGKRVRALTDAGDRIQQRAVDELNRTEGGARYAFVSTKARFAGHELLAERTNAARWLVQPFTDAPLADFDLWYHPNRTGHEETAKVLAASPRVPRTSLF